MADKTMITAHAAIYAVFAAALFFLPDVMWPLYGLEINDQYARFLSQHTSIFLGGVAALSWSLRDEGETGAVAGKVLIGLLWTDGLGVVITLYACLTGVFTGFGWSDPAFFALLSILCILQIRKNRTTASHEPR